MNAIQKVFRKEAREMFRDRRVRVSAFIMPGVVLYLIFNLLGFIGNVIATKDSQKVHVVRSDNPMVAKLQEAKFPMEIVESVDAGKKLIEKGKARTVISFGPVGGDNGQTRVEAYYDPKQETGELTTRVVEKVFSTVNEEATKAVLKDKNVPVASAEPIHFVRQEIQVGEKGSAGEMLVQFLPYLLIMFAFSGGISVATEMVAGEKEKNTLETLLISPVRRTQIVLGKFLSLMLVCLLSVSSGMAGMFLFAATKASSSPIFHGGFGITPKALLTVFVVLLPMVAFFAGLLIAVSSYAKNTREAQTHLQLVNIAVIMPAVFSQFIGFTDFGNSFAINFVPILNTASVIRNALLGKTDALGVAVTVALSLVLAAIGVQAAVWLFNREQVLTRV